MATRKKRRSTRAPKPRSPARVRKRQKKTRNHHHPELWGLGLVALLVLTLLAPNPILLLILVVGGLELWRRWRARDTEESRAYYRVKPWQRAVTGVTYIGLAVLLALAMSATHIERTF